MDPVVSVTIDDVPNDQAPQLPSKRKRGRPRKMPDIAMEMVARDTLNEIRGALGMDQLTDHQENSAVEPPVNTMSSQPPPVKKNVTFVEAPPPLKRGRGRPRKNPLPPTPVGPPPRRRRPRKHPLPQTTPQNISTILNPVPEIVTIPPLGMLQNVTASPQTVAVQPIIRQKVALSQPGLEAAKVESSEVDVGGIDDKFTVNKHSVFAMIVPPPELLPEAKSQVDITPITATTNSAVNVDSVITKTPEGVPIIPIPLPSVGGLELPSVTGVAQKRKRGRPPKPKPDGPAAKRPRGRPRKNPLPPDSIPKAASIGAGENAPSQLVASPPVKRGRGRPRKSETLAKQALKEKVRAQPHSASTTISPTKQAPLSQDAPRTAPSSEQPLKTMPLKEQYTTNNLNELPTKPVDNPSVGVSTQPVKRGRGRPRKHPLPTSPVTQPSTGGPVQPVKKGGRPRKHPLPTTPAEQPVKRGRGRPRKNPTSPRPRGRPRIHPKPDPDAPVVKRKPGRPRKHPVQSSEPTKSTSKTNQGSGDLAGTFMVAVKPLESPVRELDASDTVGPPKADTQPVVKRKRGRPRKNPPTAIPAQSSEPVATAIPAGDSCANEHSSILNASSDSSKTGNSAFQLMLSSSDSEPADSSDLANAIATLEEFPREASPLLDDRFVESSDEDD